MNGALAQSVKVPLIINMDEASVAFHLTGVVGTVLKTGRFSRLRLGDRAKLSARRGALTYIASICNDPAFNDFAAANIVRKLPPVRPTDHTDCAGRVASKPLTMEGGDLLEQRQDYAEIHLSSSVSVLGDSCRNALSIS